MTFTCENMDRCCMESDAKRMKSKFIFQVQMLDWIEMSNGVHVTFKTWFHRPMLISHFTCSNNSYLLLAGHPCPFRGQNSMLPTLKNFLVPHSTSHSDFYSFSPWTRTMKSFQLRHHPLLLGQTLILLILCCLYSALGTSGKLGGRSSGRHDTQYTEACGKEMGTNGCVKCGNPLRNPGYG